MTAVEFERDGAELAVETLSEFELERLASLFAEMGERPGKRLTGHPTARSLTDETLTLGKIAGEWLGPCVRPVRLVLFDKTARRNWGVAWHQDRTIAVAERREIEGFGPWSIKQGTLHVAPPFEVLAGMITIRAHLDACSDTNAPLIIAKGSHRIGVVAADQATEVAETFEIATCVAKAGKSGSTARRSCIPRNPASTPRRRRVLQVDFAANALPGGLEWAGV